MWFSAGSEPPLYKGCLANNVGTWCFWNPIALTGILPSKVLWPDLDTLGSENWLWINSCGDDIERHLEFERCLLGPWSPPGPALGSCCPLSSLAGSEGREAGEQNPGTDGRPGGPWVCWGGIMRIQLRPDLSWVWFPYLQVRKLVQLASKISSSANLLGLKNIQVCWNWPTSSW